MDSARSWLVAAACCWINTFSFVLFRASSVIYIGIVTTFHVTREQASWPLFLAGVFYSASALGVGLLARHVAIWKLTVSGCVLCSLAVSVCAFANGIPFLAIFLGVVHGCGISSLTLCNTVIGQHFRRYRTVASGISNAGFTLGTFLYPPLVQFFLDEYGTRGGLLLCGCVMLNATAGALLHRLPPSVQQSSVTVNEQRRSLQDISDKNTNDTSETEEPFVSETIVRLEEKDFITCAEITDTEAANHLFKAHETKGLRKAGVRDDRCAMVVDPLQTRHDGVTKPTMKVSHGLLSFLWLPKFYLITVSQLQIVLNMSIYLTVIVDLAMDRNISKWDSVFLLFFYATADLFARIGSGWITDNGLMKRSLMMALNFLFWSVCLCLMPLFYSFRLQALLSFLAGWCNGATLIIPPVLFMELVGLEKFSVCFGTTCLLVGIPLLTLPDLIGYFRDTLGNYQGLFLLIGGLTSLTSLLWFWSFSQEKCFSRRRT